MPRALLGEAACEALFAARQTRLTPALVAQLSSLADAAPTVKKALYWTFARVRPFAWTQPCRWTNFLRNRERKLGACVHVKFYSTWHANLAVESCHVKKMLTFISCKKALNVESLLQAHMDTESALDIADA